MRILQISSSYPANPADTSAPFVQSIAECLAQAGHEIQIIVPWRDGQTGRAHQQAITVHWVRYSPIPQLNVIGHGRSLKSDMHLRGAAYLAIPLFMLAAVAKAVAVCRAWRPDLIYSHWALPGGAIGVLISRLLRVRHVLGLHGSDMFVANSRRVFRLAARWVFRNTAAVIACSPSLAAQAVALGADPRHVHVLPYGVDERLFVPPPANSESTRKAVVLAVGRLVEKKGFRLLIEHAIGFLGPHPEAELRIAGDGDDRNALEHAIARLPPDVSGRVRLLGNVDRNRMPEQFQHATVLVVPSIRDSAGNQDGLPNVVMEAMSCGIAVVASDLSGIGNVIEHNVTGLLVPAGDGPLLAKAVEELLSDPVKAARLGAAAAALVRSRFTWQEYARRLSAIIN